MIDNLFLPAFHFRIQFSGLKPDADAETDTHFQSVSGLKAMVVNSGNTTSVPGNKILPVLFNPVVLKRAISRQCISPLREWILENLNGSKSTPLPEVLIQVLNEEHQPVIIFRLIHVTAAGWQLGELNAKQSELLMEEISLQYHSIELLNK
jgi:phage tail-like protein